MFSSMLSSLQSLISTRFLVCSFFPSLAFWFLNAAMFFLINSLFRTYVLANVGQTAGFAALLTAAALIGVGFFAYAEYALLPTIQSVMEGNWPGWLVAIFAPAQMRRLQLIERDISENLKLRSTFATTDGASSRPEAWRKTLRDARQVGAALAVSTYTRKAGSARQIARLDRLRARSEAIRGDLIDRAVVALVLELRRNNADLPGPGGDTALDTDHTRLLDLIRYAEDYATARYRALITQRQFSFGPVPIAPTRMGNVARTVQSYAVYRYNFNFALFWSRLQLLVQKDKDFGPVLQSAKTQLDFLISCSALTLLFAVIWPVGLYATSGPRGVFIAVAILGPLASYFWYRTAVAQYRTVADLLRSSVDLFRFDLLAAFHLQSPGDVEEERSVWYILDGMHLLHEIEPLRYVPQKS